ARPVAILDHEAVERGLAGGLRRQHRRGGGELGLLGGVCAGGADRRDQGKGQGAGEDVALLHEYPSLGRGSIAHGRRDRVGRPAIAVCSRPYRIPRETDAPWRPAGTPNPAAAGAVPAAAPPHQPKPAPRPTAFSSPLNAPPMVSVARSLIARW